MCTTSPLQLLRLVSSCSRRYHSSPFLHFCSTYDKTQEINSLLSKFLYENTGEMRHFCAKEILNYSSKHHIKLWNIDGMKEFYDGVLTDLSKCTIHEAITLTKRIDQSDPFLKFFADVISERSGELNKENCLYFIHFFQKSLKDDLTYPLYERLKDIFLDDFDSNIYMTPKELTPKELNTRIRNLKKWAVFDYKAVLSLANYLSSHFHQFDLISASSLLLFMGKEKVSHCTPLLKSVNSYFLDLLRKATTIESRTKLWGKKYGYYFCRFLYFYGSKEKYDQNVQYDQEILNKITEVYLGPYDKEIHNPLFTTSLARMCRRIHYFDPALMNCIIKVSSEMMESFYVKELSELLESMVVLNHEHQEFLSKVIDVVLRCECSVNTCAVYWSIINSCVYMNHYNAEILERFLTAEMMEVSLKNKLFHDILLIKLLVALSIEKPDMDYAEVKNKPVDSRPRCYPFSFKTLDNKYVQRAFTSALGLYKTQSNSTFGSNFCRSLKMVTGNYYFISEPILFSGHMVDFEVLLGIDGKPIEVPHFRRHRPLNDALSVIGYVDSNDNKIINEKPTLSSLLNSSKESEEGKKVDIKIPLSRKPSLLLNLASDWEEYLRSTVPSVARRIVFELNGPPHYAVNAPEHCLGKDVVKKRQLEARGWEVIQVPYFEWAKLRTGDDHARYIAEKLYGRDSK